MNSRVHPNFKTKYRATNWAKYDRALVQRGDITLWVTPAAIQAWTPRSSGRRGAPRRYSDVAIETALTLRAVFRLPLRQAEGFLRSLLDLMNLTLEAPDHTTLSRRSRNMDIDLGIAHSKKDVHLIIDSTGLSIVGEGEWRAAKHGGRGKRGLRKLHLGVDRRGHILAQVLTDSSGDDAKIGMEIIKKTKGKLSSVTGDAAYDTVAIYQKAATRGARVVVPPTRSASILSPHAKVYRARQDDPSSQQGRSQEVEERVGLPSARGGGEHPLQIQVDARRQSSLTGSGCAECRGRHRVQDPEPVARLGQTQVGGHRSLIP